MAQCGDRKFMMESFLQRNFGDIKSKNSSEEVLQRWRKLCGVVKNRKRRFRFTANLTKRSEAEAVRKTNQEKLRVAVLVSKAACQFIHGFTLSGEYTVPNEVEALDFQIFADELGSIVEGHDIKKLKAHGGIEGVANKLATSTTNGITTTDNELERRKVIYGINRFTETPVRSFWVFVWEALRDMNLIILAACAFISLIVIATEGWPKGAHHGLGIVAVILLAVFVIGTINYRQSLQFKDLAKEKKKITVQVTRNGYRQKISIYELLPGDIVHLAIGDRVPTDGLFISGFSVLIDESSLTGGSEPVTINEENPFLLSGTMVQDGSCRMLVTTVGLGTQWGKSMATLSEGGDDETPLQVKLNGVAAIIGKIGLFFAVVTFAVLVQGLFRRKLEEGTHWYWSGDDALEMLEDFAVAVTIVVVAVPEVLPLAVTLSLWVFNQISSREMEKINVFKGMLKNYVFVGVLTCTVAFLVIIIEFLGDFANTTPLTSAEWFLSIFIGFLGMPIAAIIKLIPISLQAWKAWKPSFSLYLPLSISSIELSIPFSLPLPFTLSLKLVLSRSPSLSFSFSTAQAALPDDRANSSREMYKTPT